MPTGACHADGPLSARFDTDARGTLGVALGAPGGCLVITQHDVRALQLAKAAVRVAIEMVLARAGVAAKDLGTLYVSGAFGGALQVRDLVELGVVPAQSERVGGSRREHVVGGRHRCGDGCGASHSGARGDRERGSRRPGGRLRVLGTAARGGHAGALLGVIRVQGSRKPRPSGRGFLNPSLLIPLSLCWASVCLVTGFSRGAGRGIALCRLPSGSPGSGVLREGKPVNAVDNRGRLREGKPVNA